MCTLGLATSFKSKPTRSPPLKPTKFYDMQSSQSSIKNFRQKCSDVIRTFIADHWLANVRAKDIPGEAFAGLSGAAVVLPQGIAFAAIAGLPPEYGLYAAIVPTIVAAFFGSSMLMITGPTTAISAVVLSVLSQTHTIGSPAFIQMAVVLSLMVGLIQIFLSIFQAGRLAKFVSHSVMVGFTMAAALLIFTSQLGPIFGVSGFSGGSTLERLVHGWPSLLSFRIETASVAGATFLIALGVSNTVPRWPVFLIALSGGTLVALVFQTLGFTFNTIGILQSVLPRPSLPSLTFAEYIELLEGALTIALVGLLEALAIGKAFAAKTNTPFSANKETFGQGLANVAGGLFQAYPTSGSFTRTGVNYASGAKTPLAAMLSGMFLLPVIFLCAPLLNYVPDAALAGLIMYVAVRLVDIGELKRIAKSGKTEPLTVFITFASGAVLHLETALLIGVAFSVGSFLLRTSKTRLRVEAPDQMQVGREFRDVEDFGHPECPQVLFVRIDGPLYFGTADSLNREFMAMSQSRPEQSKIVVNLKGTGDIDAEGIASVRREIRRRANSGGCAYVVARSVSMVKRLEKLGLFSEIENGFLFENKNHAIREIIPTVDKTICACCKLNVFKECQANKMSYNATDKLVDPVSTE